MSEKEQLQNNEFWREFLEGRGEFSGLRGYRNLVRFLPSEPRCKGCHIPFKGIGGVIGRTFLNQRPSNKTPRFCNRCEQVARQYPGGAEVELTMLFADVRGSTALAETMSASEFSQLMNRFYSVANKILVKTEAWVDKLVGDEIIGFYFPGFTGQQHAQLAIQAGQELLQATGHRDVGGPWLPVGVGIHTGIAFVGVVGSADSHVDITALGDNVNVAARLASKAAKGEIIISNSTYAAAKLDLKNVEQRQLELKGKTDILGVYVMQVNTSYEA